MGPQKVLWRPLRNSWNLCWHHKDLKQKFKLIFYFLTVIGTERVNTLTINVPHHKKPVNWFALLINWLVSIWWRTLVVTGLNHFRPMFPLYTPYRFMQVYSLYANICKCQKTRGSLIFSGAKKGNSILKWVSAKVIIIYTNMFFFKRIKTISYMENIFIIKKINSKNIYNNLVLHINDRPANKFLYNWNQQTKACFKSYIKLKWKKFVQSLKQR